MLDIDHLKPGSQLILPEVVGNLGVQNPEFELLEIHPGGMGVCLRIKSLANFQSYALKYIRPELLGDNDSLDRFHDELEVWIPASVCNAVAEAIAIVRINDIPSVLATWMEGGDLTRTHLKLDPAQKFESIVRICRALQWVQGRLGVIHRDLKPANILFDGELLAYLSDWGIARPIRHAFARARDKLDFVGIDRPDRTQIGSFLGTITYAAPEQFIDSTAVDHRADIYAMGCIMFVLETGSPPFSGSSIRDIAAQHLDVEPPKLGGPFRQTTLGLERVIDRCLAKNPNSRYATYTELDNELVAIAEKRKFSLDRCIISERYKRHQLGKGNVAQQQILANATSRNNEFALVELDDMQPYLEGANNLIALGRYKEAEVLLRPVFIPEMVETSTRWHFGHACVEIYALCLQHISGRLDESLDIYEILNLAQDKPVEFYINYSLALLRASKWTNAKKVCQAGLGCFPEDIDLLGNYTISLIDCGDIEQAQSNAMRRLAIRRDVYSIAELVSVLRQQRNRLRNSELPKAISLAETQYNLVKEGLSSNPSFPGLRLAEIQILRFAHATSKVLAACQAMMDDVRIPAAFRQFAFLEMVETIGESENFKTALELIDKFENDNLNEEVRERRNFIRFNILADKYMIGRDDQSGKRIVVPEIVDFFLSEKEGVYQYPVMAARVLEWIGRINEAETILRGVDADSEKSWSARKELACLLQRDGRFNEAVAEAKILAESAPWRAESHDVLSFVANKAGDVRLANEARKNATLTFDREMEHFKKLQTLML